MRRGVFFVFIIIAIFFIFGYYMLGRNDDIESENIVKIYFPEYAGELDKNIEILNEIDGAKIKNGDLLKKYYKVSSEDRSNKICSYFKMKEDEKNETIVSKKAGITYIQEDSKLLKIYDNGSFYYNKMDDNSKCQVMLSDKKCIDIADKFLKDNNLISEDFKFTGVGYDLLTDLQDEDNEIIVAKNIYYSRTLNKIDIYGNSKIMVSVNEKGDISEVYASYGDIEKQIIVNEDKIVSIDEAINEAVQLKGFIDCPSESDKIILERIEVVFWEDSAPYSDNNTIQPVYRIEGSAYKNNEYIGEVSIIESSLK